LWHRSDGRGLEQPTWDALARHFDESQLIEVLMVVGSYVGLAGFLNAVELEREAGVPGLPWTPKVGATLRAVLPLIEQKSDRAFLDRMPRHHASKLEHIVNAYTQEAEDHVPIHPEHAARVLDELADDDAIFTVDTGMCNVWAARYLTPNGRRRVIGSFSHGTMANALPQAIGAQLGNPHRQVISMSGDGGLGMLLGELLTVALHRLPIKIVLFNNSSLGMVKLEMLVDGLPDYETDHAPVDYSAIARAAGIHSVRVEKPADLRSALVHSSLRALFEGFLDVIQLPGPIQKEGVGHERISSTHQGGHVDERPAARPPTAAAEAAARVCFTQISTRPDPRRGDRHRGIPDRLRQPHRLHITDRRRRGTPARTSRTQKRLGDDRCRDRPFPARLLLRR